MIWLDPEAALELLEARDYYDRQRPGLGTIFQNAYQRTLDAVEANAERFPQHRFSDNTQDPPRALFSSAAVSVRARIHDASGRSCVCSRGRALAASAAALGDAAWRLKTVSSILVGACVVQTKCRPPRRNGQDIQVR